MSKKTEALKLALEALEVVTKELLAVRDELAERGGRPKTNVFHQRLWDSSFSAYADKAIPAAEAIRETLEQPAQHPDEFKCPLCYDDPANIKPAQPQEPVAWIYKLNMELLWPDEIEVKDPSKHRGYKPLYTSPPASKPLTDEEWEELADRYGVVLWRPLKSDVEAKLREKNA